MNRIRVKATTAIMVPRMHIQTNSAFKQLCTYLWLNKWGIVLQESFLCSYLVLLPTSVTTNAAFGTSAIAAGWTAVCYGYMDDALQLHFGIMSEPTAITMAIYCGCLFNISCSPPVIRGWSLYPELLSLRVVGPLIVCADGIAFIRLSQL